MIVYAALAALLMGAALCFGLSRIASTRWLGLMAVAILLLAGSFVALVPPSRVGEAPMRLLELGTVVFSVSPFLGAGERAIAVTLLAGGGAALLVLAGAVAPTVRGFGGIFAWALITLAAALLSLASPPLSLTQPLAWAVLSIGGYATLRASGAASNEQATPPLGLVLGLLASVLLAGSLLAGGTALATGDQPPWWVALGGLVAALALAGCPPLVNARDEARDAPAPLGALVYGLAAPAAALGWVLRAVAGLPVLPAGWAVLLSLIGALGVLACSAGALGERRLRPMLLWATGGQAAAVVAAAGLSGPLAALAGPGLLVGLMLTAVVGSGAAVTLERTTGSDDYTLSGSTPPRIAGLVWVGFALASVGLPPLWNFWPRLWLLETAYEQQPWLLAPLVAGGVLMTLALAAPLGRLWGAGTRVAARAGLADVAPAALAILPLLVLGVAPGLVWTLWLQGLPFAPGVFPVTLDAQIVALGAGLVLLVMGGAIALARPSRAIEPDPDEEPAYLAPDALGLALSPVRLAGRPGPLLQWLWVRLLRFSEVVRFVIELLFEQRFYLLGVLAALIIVMLLMAQ